MIKFLLFPFKLGGANIEFRTNIPNSKNTYVFIVLSSDFYYCLRQIFRFGDFYTNGNQIALYLPKKFRLMMRNQIIFILFIFILNNLTAQPFLVRDQSIPVNDNELALSLPWAGGLNNPQFSSYDFNNDGTPDLFVFDKSGNVILPMIKTGPSGSMDFQFSPQYNIHFPKLGDWALLRDFNCDGMPDIFTYSLFGPGAMVYQNIGTDGVEWFEIADSLLLTYFDIGSSTGTVNIFISTIDVPVIDDFDGDGDLDIFTFEFQGQNVEFHKNFSVENGQGCDLDYELKNRCWGYFSENPTDNGVILGIDCFNVNDPADIEPLAVLHTGSTLLMLDLDGNNFKDLIIGDLNFNTLTAVLNGGPSDAGPDSMVASINDFPNPINPNEIITFPASYYEDVNNDGIKDLIVSPNAEFVSEDVDAVDLYLNTGANNNPQFTLTSNAFLQEDMIDVGEGAYPVFFDVDKDGLIDLLVGNRKRIKNGIENASINYFKNTGSASNPAFSLISDDFFELSTKNIGAAFFPSFMDLNGDNAEDLIIGNLDGNIYFIINQASPGQEVDFSGVPVLLQDNLDVPIDVGQMAKPQAVDLNEDNLIDLVIGQRGGFLYYYENTGSAALADFTLITESLGNVKAPGFLLNTGNSSPFFYKVDDQWILLLGSETGKLDYYNQISNNLDGEFNEIPGPASGIDEGERVVPAVFDLNNDNLPDLMLGNYRGGLSFFKGDLVSSISEIPDEIPVNIYPNPAKNKLTIVFGEVGNFKIVILNSLGQQVQSTQLKNQLSINLNISGWAAGQYFVKIADNNKVVVKPLVIIR